MAGVIATLLILLFLFWVMRNGWVLQFRFMREVTCFFVFFICFLVYLIIRFTPISICCTGCKINATVLAKKCNDNNTPLDESDDTWSFQVQTFGTNAGKSGWRLQLGTSYINGAYGGLQTVAGLPAGQDVSVAVFDAENPFCKTALLVSHPGPCSKKCDLSVNVYDRVQHTNKLSDPNDDRWSFQLIVDGNNVSKKGWRTQVKGKTIKGQFGLPRLVDGLTSAAPITLTIYDAGNTRCSTHTTVEFPNEPAPPPPGGGGAATPCAGLKNCFALDGFSVGQLPDRNILSRYESPSDPRRQKKFFQQFHTRKGWINVPVGNINCNGAEYNVAGSTIIADSFRVVYFMPLTNGGNAGSQLRLLTFEVVNGNLQCLKIRRRNIREDDPFLKN